MINIFLTGVCIICKETKVKKLNQKQRNCLPNEILSIPINNEVKDNIEKDGGTLPIIPLIGAIAAGISALTGAAGVTASTILKAKENAEQSRHNQALENIARGSGIQIESESD
jgi:hypothetical protein